MFYHQLEIIGQIHNLVLSVYSTLLSVDETLYDNGALRYKVALQCAYSNLEILNSGKDLQLPTINDFLSYERKFLELKEYSRNLDYQENIEQINQMQKQKLIDIKDVLLSDATFNIKNILDSLLDLENNIINDQDIEEGEKIIPLMVSVGVRASVAFWYQASINESSAYYEKANGDSIFPADSDLAGIPPWLKRVFRDAIGILTGGAAGILVAGGAVALEIITAGAATPIIAGAVAAAGGAASAK